MAGARLCLKSLKMEDFVAAGSDWVIQELGYCWLVDRLWGPVGGGGMFVTSPARLRWANGWSLSVSVRLSSASSSSMSRLFFFFFPFRLQLGFARRGAMSTRVAFSGCVNRPFRSRGTSLYFILKWMRPCKCGNWLMLFRTTLVTSARIEFWELFFRFCICKTMSVSEVLLP